LVELDECEGSVDFGAFDDYGVETVSAGVVLGQATGDIIS
jgi:hypothetical protein